MRTVVIGATGQIGTRLVEVAHQDGHEVVGVSRRPPATLPIDWRTLDASDPGQLTPVLRDADAVIATLGLRYDIATWRERWVPLTRSVVTAVRDAGVPLVWLDNCYLYGAAQAPITEETAIAPCSTMGRVRAEVNGVLTEAGHDRVPITGARAADFLGSGVETTLVPWTPLERVARPGHRHARMPWIGDPETSHSYSSACGPLAGLVELVSGEGDDVEGVHHTLRLDQLHHGSEAELVETAERGQAGAAEVGWSTSRSSG